MFIGKKEYFNELRKIREKISEFLSDVDPRLVKMNAGFAIYVQVTMAGFEWPEWPTDDLRHLVEEFVSSEEALGIPIAGLEELLAVLYYREREEKKKKAKTEKAGA